MGGGGEGGRRGRRREERERVRREEEGEEGYIEGEELGLIRVQSRNTSSGYILSCRCCSSPPELPTLLPVVQVAEALLRLRNGPQLLVCLVANLPDQLDQGEKPA